jgi:hypothetical protein
MWEGFGAKSTKRRSTEFWKWGGKHRLLFQGTDFMKKLGWDGTLDASGMMDWHIAVARWHVECGTGRELGDYVINRCEELMRIPVPGFNGRILQVGKKKTRSNARRRCWESEVGVRKQEVEGMRIDGLSTRRKLWVP